METKKEIVTDCSNLKPMAEWIRERDDKICRPCLLGPLASWYSSELKEQGKINLSSRLEEITNNRELENMPLTLCKEMDYIKSKVESPLRERLKDFDCATQNFSPYDV